MDSKVVFIDMPYYAVNNPLNDLRIYKRIKNGKTRYVQCKDKEHYKQELTKYICGFYNYSRNESKAHSSMLGYFMGEKKSDDIMERNKMKREEMAMLKDGTFIKDDMVENMQKKWSKYLINSNINLAVLSLYQDYVDENINIKELQKEVATKIMPRFLNYCGYDDPKKNLEWIVSLHSDRENNYHFHIAWIEKNKSFKYQNNKVDYKIKLKLKDNERNFIKRLTSLTIERQKLYQPAIIQINKDLEELKKYFNPKDNNFTLRNISNLNLEEDIIRLGYLLSTIREKDKKYIKFGSLPRNDLGKEIRKLTKEIKTKIFSINKDIQLSKNEVNKSIEKLNNIFLDIDRRNNISNVGFESAFENKMILDKLEKTDNYILNAIVNHALYNYDYNLNNYNRKLDKITLEDLIGEISLSIYKNSYKNNYSKNNKNKIKLKILKNYFIYGKYENCDKLSNALRRLSKNSERAAEKFYEMLSDDSYDVINKNK